jgi:hypothetical protein
MPQVWGAAGEVVVDVREADAGVDDLAAALSLKFRSTASWHSRLRRIRRRRGHRLSKMS